jgi:hypothetical protein
MAATPAVSVTSSSSMRIAAADQQFSATSASVKALLGMPRYVGSFSRSTSNSSAQVA